MSLNLDTIRTNQAVVEDVYISLYDFTGIEIAEITSSSDYISARQVEASDFDNEKKRIPIRLTVGPGLAPGLLSESITVRFKDTVRPNSQMYLYAVVVDDVEVIPLVLSFGLRDPEHGNQGRTKRLLVINYDEDLPLEVLEVSMPGDYLELLTKTIIPGTKFEITARVTDAALAVDSMVNDSIIIITNNPEFKTLSVPVRIFKE